MLPGNAIGSIRGQWRMERAGKKRLAWIVVELVSGDPEGCSVRFEQIAPLGVFGLVDLAPGEPVVQGAQSIRSARSGC